MHAVSLECGVQDRNQLRASLDTVAGRSIALCVGDKVGIGKGQAVVRKAKLVLLPADHPVCCIIQNENDKVQSKPDGRFQFLRVHHEPAIAAYREHSAPRRQHRRHHGRWKACAHRRQCIVEKDGTRFIRNVVSGEPDLVDAVVERNDIILLTIHI